MDARKNKQKNPNQRRSLYLVNIIMLCLITLAALGCTVFLVFRVRSYQQSISDLNTQVASLQETNSTMYTQSQLDQEVNRAASQAQEKEHSAVLMQIQSSLESGNTTTSMLRSLFADDLVVVSNSKYYFFPVYNSLDKSLVGSGDFSYDDTGTLQYVGNDQSISIRRGVDVSARNGEIDWEAAAGDGISFAMLCAGSADEDGVITDDSSLSRNLKEAKAQKLDIGIYFVMNAMDAQEAGEQADHVVETLQGQSAQITCPVAVVVREPDKESRLSELTRAEFTQNVLAFCQTIEDAGYVPMIYGNLAAFLMRTDLTQLNDYEKWIADFSDQVYFPYRYSYWQYSTSGQVSGIDTSVHLDLQIVKDGE